ncbi:cytochrome c heme lyase [Jimgerdemannia flammicorona]|uniref:Holocytochrome c-type synthase n=1 Tax=Jimgerdemannia flammicorona TaxID=994334 RepID=A0A433D3T3_9FUNG|nr:cytochrome c heme lyase [Jimgerdemannia flammicorona]
MASCPMHQQSQSTLSPPPSCPMHNPNAPHSGTSSPTPVTDALNQLNMMPDLSQAPALGQQIDLPTERVISSIPKSDGASRWEYPSPQQFYNALRRKGWETPEEEIETMVDIHNFLNEEAWNEVLKWEAMHECPCPGGPKLARFRGKPQELSPKARILSWLGSPRPFDRHDWVVDRCGREVRYVIDYYSAPEDIPGQPVFHLDVRPALDSVESLLDRAKVAAREKFETWWGKGGAGVVEVEGGKQ